MTQAFDSLTDGIQYLTPTDGGGGGGYSPPAPPAPPVIGPVDVTPIVPTPVDVTPIVQTPVDVMPIVPIKIAPQGVTPSEVTNLLADGNPTPTKTNPLIILGLIAGGYFLFFNKKKLFK